MPYALPTLVQVPTDAPLGQVMLGHVVALNPEGELLVRLGDAASAPQVARLAAPHDRAAVLNAIAQHQPALIAQMAECRTLVVLSFLVPPAALAPSAPCPSIEHHADRLVLKAGAAAITLHTNGKVDIRGVRINARAKTDHRITGHTVHIN